MRICGDKKLLFISKWKCGSETIREILDPHTTTFSTQNYPFYHHTTARELSTHMGDSLWGEFFSFISIRNPWDMLVSLYIYAMPDVEGKYWWERYWDDVRKDIERPDFFIPPEQLMPFSDWVINQDLSQFTLENFAFDSNGECLVSKIIKLENFNNDLNFLTNEFDIDFELTKNNTTKHKHYSFYFDDELATIVEHKFKKDIEIGGYFFEDMKVSRKDFSDLSLEVSKNSFYQLKKYASRFQRMYNNESSAYLNVQHELECLSIDYDTLNVKYCEVLDRLSTEKSLSNELYKAKEDVRNYTSNLEKFFSVLGVRIKLGKPLLNIYFSPLFCLNYYNKQVGVDFSSRLKAISHYINYGEALGMKPNPFFDPKFKKTVHSEQVGSLNRYILSDDIRECSELHQYYLRVNGIKEIVFLNNTIGGLF